MDTLEFFTTVQPGGRVELPPLPNDVNIQKPAENADSAKLQELLLNGPTWTDEEYNEWLERFNTTI